MAAYSIDLRVRVLRDADAGLPSDELAEKYSRQSRVGRSAEARVGAKPARWRLASKPAGARGSSTPSSRSWRP